MSEFLAPVNYNRARDVLRRLSPYATYTPEGARAALDVLRQAYPLVFSRMEEKAFANGAILLEMPGANVTGPLLFTSHLDAQGESDVNAPEHARPMSVPLSRAHGVTLLEALEGLLSNGYQPGGDLLLALSMDGLDTGAGAKSIAAHLKARSVEPCFVLDHGGYATMEAFRTYLPRESPLALVGVCEKGRLHARLTLEKGGTVGDLLRCGARLSRRGRRMRLCSVSRDMLIALGARAPLLQRWFVRSPGVTFPLMRLMWRKRAGLSQVFAAERAVTSVSVDVAHRRAKGEMHVMQTLLAGQKNVAARQAIRRAAQKYGLNATFPLNNDPSPRSDAHGEAWEALTTAVEIQFERSVVVPCLCPFPTDARFYAPLCRRVYRFSPFLLTGREAMAGECTVTDGTLQTAVQFFRSMLSV